MKYYVQIETNPSNAEIYFASSYFGNSPTSIGNLEGNYPMLIRKPGYEDFTDKTITIKDAGKTLKFNLVSLTAPKEYPKDISRGPYTIRVDNSSQEKQAKEFLGIDPSGDNLDTWLSKRDLSGLKQWKNYWTNIFSNVGMNYWISFVNNKFEEYKSKIEIIPPKKPWWLKLLEVLKPSYLNRLLTSEIAFKKGYELLTDKELTDEEYAKVKAEIVDFILPVNLALILATGKNLKGEDVAVGDTEYFVELAMLALIVTPVKFIGKLGAKLGTKIGGKGLIKVADKMVLKKANSKQIIELLKGNNYQNVMTAIRNKPVVWGKFTAKLNQEARNLLFASMKEFADPTAFNAAVKAVGKKEALKTLSGFLRLLKPWAYGTVALMGGVTFVEFLYEEAIQTRGMGIWTAVSNKQWDIAYETLAESRKFLNHVSKIYKYAGLLSPFTYDVFNRYAQATKAQYDIFEQVILRKSGVIPDPSIDGKVFDKKQFRKFLTTHTIPEITDLIVQAIIEKAPEKVGTLIVLPDPSDSDVSVDKLAYIDSGFEREVEIGIYRVTVSKWKYVSQTKDLEVKEGEITKWEPVLIIEEEFPPMISKIIINVEPTDAKITVANYPEITTSGEYEVATGTYTIDFSKTGYVSQRRTVYLDEGETETIAVILSEEEIKKPPVELLGKLHIYGIPDDLIIEIAGHPEIITVGNYEVKAGTYDIKASKENYQTQTKQAFVREGKTCFIAFSLQEEIKPPEIPIKAKLEINSDPSDADVYIDGVYKYTTTPYTIYLDEGTYTIRVQKKNYIPYEADISLAESDDVIMNFPLTEEIDIDKEITPYYPNLPYLPIYEIPKQDPPQMQLIPYQQIKPFQYNLLDPQYSAPKGFKTPDPEVTRDLLINIETTGVHPWNSKAYSIAVQDLSRPEEEPIVFINDDEKQLLIEFLEYFNYVQPERFVGFKVIFDYRWIYALMMKYRISNEHFKKIALRDVKQLMDQIKEEFVYYPDKKGTLNDWGKYLFGIGKYGSQETMLKKYISGDFDYVNNFQLRQLDLTNGLYQLFLFCGSGLLPEALTPISTPRFESGAQELPKEIKSQQTKICQECLQENLRTNETCFICGSTKFK